MSSPPDAPPRRVSFPPDVESAIPPPAPYTSSPPSSPSLHPNTLPAPVSTPAHTGSGINPAPVSTSASNVALDGPRRRPNRGVTVDSNHSHVSAPNAIRRGTSDSARSSRRGTVDPNAGVLRRMTTGLFTPDRKIGRSPTYRSSIRAAVTSSWLCVIMTEGLALMCRNVLLVFIPIGESQHGM